MVYNHLMQKVIPIYKKISQTPLEAINEFRTNNHDYKNSKIAYAGRLDPMAHGLLLLLVDEECKKRDQYQDLEKEYIFEMIFGIETDSLDILGKLSYFSPDKIDQSNLESVIKNLVGEFEFEYPIFSSKTVMGKPLFQWARENRLEEITIPKITKKIYSLSLIEKRQVKFSEILKIIIERIQMINGDFRQELIVNEWTKRTQMYTNEHVDIWKFKAHTQSGAYVRSLIKKIASEMNTRGIAYEILRTRVGSFEEY